MRKRLLYFIFGALFLLGLSACGAADVADSAEISLTPSSSVSSTSTGSSAEEPTVKTCKVNARVNTLGENVDQMPGGAEMYQDNGEKVSLASYDYTTPADSYYEDKSEFYNQNQEIWDMIDSFRNFLINRRDVALAEIKELGTYFTVDGIVKLKMEYDSITDELHIFNIETNAYIEITSGYTNDGRIHLNGIIYSTRTYVNDNYTHITKYYRILDYTEDEKATYLYYGFSTWVYPEYTQYSYTEILMNSDMVTKEVAVMWHSVEYSDQTGAHNSEYFTTLVQGIKDGLKYQIYHRIDYQDYAGNLYNYSEDKISVYDENDHLIAMFDYYTPAWVELVSEYYMDKHEFYFPLYSLNGWTSAVLDDANQFNVTINEQVYNSDIISGDNTISFMNTSPANGSAIPYVKISNKHENLNYSACMEILKTNLGLTPKTDLTTQMADIVDNYKTLEKEKKIFGDTDLSDMDKTKFYSIFSVYDTHKYTFEEIEEIYNTPALDMCWQGIADITVGYMDVPTTGSAILDTDNLTINLKNVKAYVQRSAFLVRGVEYNAALILQGDTAVIIKKGIGVKFDGKNNLVLEFEDENIDLKPYLLECDGEYTLRLVVGAKYGSFIRISADIELKTDLDKDVYIALPDFVEELRYRDRTLIGTFSRTFTMKESQNKEKTVFTVKVMTVKLEEVKNTSEDTTTEETKLEVSTEE